MVYRIFTIDAVQPYEQVIAEYDNSGNATAEYVYGLERISQDRGGSVHVYLADGQGSIRELTDGVGNVTDEFSYFAFGEILNRTGNTDNEWTYTGEAYNPNIGFIYLRARWMNPQNSRFISVDPFIGYQDAPMTIHRYLYANASPINFSDPSGMVTLGELTQTMTIQGLLTNMAIGSAASMIGYTGSLLIGNFSSVRL